MDNYNGESTGIIDDSGFNAWADKLEKMSDIEVSQEVFNRVMTHSDLDDDSKKLLKDSYEYCTKLIRQRKPLEVELLKIYLEQIKGYNVSEIQLYNLIAMLGCCGIIF